MHANKHEFVLLTYELHHPPDVRLLHRSVTSLAAAKFFDCGE
jgi:hypothetical protein